jgi:hypothetical protein
MAQHDYVIANGTGAAVRSDLNNALSAIVTQNSGSTAPATTYAYMMWPDTTAGVMKMRNGANSAWITLYQLDGEWTSIAFENGSAAAPSIYFKDSGTDTGFYSPGANQVGISTGGTAALVIDSSQRVGLGTSSPGANLEVVGGTTATGPGAELRLSSADQTIAAADEVIGSITFNSNDASSGMAGYFAKIDAISNRIFDGDPASGMHMRFFTGTGNNGANTPVERLRITSGGNVGIGTTTPQAHLDVRDNVGGNSRLDIHSQGANGMLTTLVSERLGPFRISCESNTAAIAFNTGSSGTSERARIDSSGRLLVGTSSARANLFKAGVSAALQVEGVSGSDGRRMVLAYNSNDGGAPEYAFVKSRGTSLGSNTVVQSGDGLGAIYFNGTDGTSDIAAASILAVVDGTPGTNDMPGRLVFSTTADGASSPTERMRITNSGSAVHFAAGSVHFAASASGAGTTDTLYLGRRSATSTTTGTDVYAVYTNGTYATLSDQTQKKNIETTRNGYLEDLNRLRIVKYNWNTQEDSEPKELGLIAQEVEQVFPGLVSELGSDGGAATNKGIKAGVLPFMLIKALQEATARIETLEAEVAALKGA